MIRLNICLVFAFPLLVISSISLLLPHNRESNDHPDLRCSNFTSNSSLKVEQLVSCVTRPDWVLPFYPRTFGCERALQKLRSRSEPMRGVAHEFYSKNVERKFWIYPGRPLPRFQAVGNCVVSVVMLREIAIPWHHWIPELPDRGDPRPWPPGFNDLATRTEMLKAADDVFETCMVARGEAGYARFGDLRQGIGVFIWGKGSPIDMWAESMNLKDRNVTVETAYEMWA